MPSGVIQRVSKEAFAPYGEYYHVSKETAIGDWYKEYSTAEKVVQRPLKFGITCVENDQVFPIDSMERHLSSEEVQFACAKPIVLSVADTDPWENPKAEDVASFLLEPGDVVVLKRGIWHDACHSVGEKTMYYFLSYTNGDPTETTWLPVVPEPVMITL